MNRALRLFLLLQSLYYLVTGIWSLVSIGSFQVVTGPKVDLWLVRMVGLLAVAVGGALYVGWYSRSRHPSLLVLSIATAAAFFIVDTVYSLSRVISYIYLGDALVEVVLAAGVSLSWRRS